MLLDYIQTTQKRSLSHLKRAVVYEPSDFLEMDHNSQYNLELIKNIRTGKKKPGRCFGYWTKPRLQWVGEN